MRLLWSSGTSFRSATGLWWLLLAMSASFDLGFGQKVLYTSGPLGLGPTGSKDYVPGGNCGKSASTRAWDKELAGYNDSSYNPNLTPVTEIRLRAPSTFQTWWGDTRGADHGYVGADNPRPLQTFKLKPGEVITGFNFISSESGAITNLSFTTNISRTWVPNWPFTPMAVNKPYTARGPSAAEWQGPPIQGDWYLAYTAMRPLGWCCNMTLNGACLPIDADAAAALSDGPSWYFAPQIFLAWAADVNTPSSSPPYLQSPTPDSLTPGSSSGVEPLPSPAASGPAGRLAGSSPPPPPPSPPPPPPTAPLPAPRTPPPTSLHPTITADCTVNFTGSDSNGSWAVVACTNERLKGLVTVAPTLEGVTVHGQNVTLNDSACWSLGQAATNDSAPLALIQICIAAPGLVMRFNVSGVLVLPGRATAALGVVATRGITLADGLAQLVSGGTAVYLAAAGKVKVLNSRFEYNNAPASVWGGGLAVVALKNLQEVIMADCAFLSNVAGAGAGAWLDVRAATLAARVVVKGLTYFGSCTSTDLYGGGLRIEADGTTNATVRVGGNTSFVRNSDGALMVSFVGSTHGKVVISDNVAFQHNNNTDNQGGALFCEFMGSTAGEVSLQGLVSLWDNTAGDMSSLDAYPSIDSNGNTGPTRGPPSGGEPGLYNATVSNRPARQDGGTTKFYGGGAVYAGFLKSKGGAVRVKGNVTFLGNRALNDGGGLYVNFIGSTQGTARISEWVRFEQNTAGTWGGGAMLAFETATRGSSSVLNSTGFLGNVAYDTGGGLAVDMNSANASRVVVQGALFHGNSAAFAGGGLAVYGNYSINVSVSVQSSYIHGNRVEQGYGGGMVLVAGPPTSEKHNNVTLTIENSNFTDNWLGSGVGGGLLIDGTSRAVRLAPCATTDIFSCSATAVLRGVAFTNNNATLGGGLYTINTQCTVKSALFASNSASQSGGGAFAKGTVRLGFFNTTFESNRAIVQGGGLATALGDDFQDSITACRRCNFASNSAAAGAGAHHFGGRNLYYASNITLNAARQHGGGIEYQDTCGGPSSQAAGDGQTQQSGSRCGLRLEEGTLVVSNSAVAGGGVFLGMPNSPGVNITLVRNVTVNNTGRYAEDVAEAPDMRSLEVVSVAQEPVPSSTGDVGRTGLVVSTSRCFTRLQVEFCEVQRDMTLTGIEEATGTSTNTCVNAMAASATGPFYANFINLRVMGAAPGNYCLRVFAADYPMVEPRNFTLMIRACNPGEFYAPTSGCTPCSPGSFTFASNGTCQSCGGTNANCPGGAKYVPTRGYWHSAWNSTHVMQCPYKGACSGNRKSVAGCQEARNQTCGKEQVPYADLLCVQGYKGKLCMQCAHRYGSGLMFRCHKCKSRPVTAVLLLLVFSVISFVIAGIGLRAVSQQISATSPGGAPTSSMHNLGKDTAPSAQPGSSNTSTSSSNVPSKVPHAPQQQSAVALARLATSLVGDMLVADVFKVLVVYLQYIGILRNLVIDWPRGLRGLMDLGKVVLAPDSSGWVSLDCLGRVGGGAQLWIRILLSVLTIIAASALACGLVALWPAALRLLQGISRLVGARWRPASGGPRERPPLLDVAIATAVVGLFVKYANLVAITLSAFACMKVDGGRYWARDPDLRCYQGRHLQEVMPVGVLGLAVVCILVPLGILYVGRRRDTLKDPAAVSRHNRRYGFLYRLYHDRFRPWEAVLCLQTVALVSVDHFARQLGPLYQLVWIMVVLLTVCALWAWWKPFVSDKLTVLYLAGMHCLMFTCLVMMLMLRGYRLDSGQGEAELSTPSRVVAAVLMALINIVFVVACLAAMLVAAIVPMIESGSLVWRNMRARVSQGLCLCDDRNGSPARPAEEANPQGA